MRKHGVFSPTHVIFARFEFDSVIYYHFCSFRVSLIYWWWFVVVIRLEDYSTLFLLIFGLMELLTFLWKTCFVEKVFKINLSKNKSVLFFGKKRENRNEFPFFLSLLCLCNILIAIVLLFLFWTKTKTIPTPILKILHFFSII